MKNPLTSNRFWALPEDSAEIILRDLGMRSCGEDTSVSMGPDGSWGVSSADGQVDACKPAQAGALISDGAPVVTPGGVAVIQIDDVRVGHAPGSLYDFFASYHYNSFFLCKFVFRLM